MSLTLPPNIDAEVQAAHLSVIDLIQVDFGGGLERRWSTVHIPRELSANLTGNYEARLVSIGDRRWSLGADDDSINLILGNADNSISNFVRSYGIDIFEGAKVRHHRLFPGIRETYLDYWVGRGTAIQFERKTASWDVRFGLAALRQRALRRYQRNCPHVFAGGTDSDCPYNPEEGFGIPQPVVFGTATAGTTIDTLVNSEVGAFNLAVPGMFVYNRNANCISRIISVTSQNELSLSNPIAGAGTGTAGRWRTGDRYFIGYAFTSCDKTTSACDARGMLGANRNSVNGLMDGRKYFGGSSGVADISFRGRSPKDGSRFTRSTLGNRSFDGEPIPVIFGITRIYGRESIEHANAGRFQYGLFVLCEGEILDIDFPKVNERDPDDFNSQRDIAHTVERTGVTSRAGAIAAVDPFIKFGTWEPDGVDDDRVYAITASLSRDIARHVRESSGRRASIGVKFGNVVLDAYNWADNNGVIQINNPNLFVDGSGGGVSLHGLAAARVRIDTNEDDSSVLTGDFTVYGLMVQMPDNMPFNTEDRGRFNLPVGITDVISRKYTPYPNPIQASYAFLRNRRWGAGLSDASINIPSFLRESAYCEEVLNGTPLSASTTLRGVVDYTSGIVDPDVYGSKYFFSSSLATINANSALDLRAFAQALVYRRITFNPLNVGDMFSAIILSAVYVPNPYAADIDQESNTTKPISPTTPSPPGVDIPNHTTGSTTSSTVVELEHGFLFRLDRVAPAVGTNFTIDVGTGTFGGTKRYKANGALVDDVSAVEMFQSILDNCHGIFRANAGQVEVIIKKELSDSEIDNIISNHLFTDRGRNRNILYNADATSSIRVWRKSVEDTPNEYSVEFLDSTREYRVSRLVIFDENAQTRAATKLGERGDRRKLSESAQLGLTSSIEQAKRLLTLRIREVIIQNLFCSFSTSLKNGMRVQPGDIIAIDSNEIIGLFNTQILIDDVSFGDSFLFRVMEKSESEAYTIDLMCQLHVNSLYSDVVRDYGDLFSITRTASQKIGAATSVIPITPIENTFIDPYGLTQSQIRVKVTYPNVDEA